MRCLCRASGLSALQEFFSELPAALPRLIYLDVLDLKGLSGAILDPKKFGAIQPFN
jgi:hypothetical protein